MGKMYGALLLNPEPMSLDDLMNHLDISKASVSMNMRTLENMGIAREVWVRGDRRKYYEAEPDFWKILTNVLGGRELREVNQALNVLDNDLFLPLAGGIAVMILASGISLVRSVTLLPHWLGWVAVVIGILGFTPAGFFAFLASGLWVLVVSVLLLGRWQAVLDADAPAVGGAPPPAY